MKRLVKLSIILILVVIMLTLSSCFFEDNNYVPNKVLKDVLPPYYEVNSENDCNHNMEHVFVRGQDKKMISACTKCGYSQDGYKYYKDQIVDDNFAPNSKIIIKLNANYSNKQLYFGNSVEEIVFVGVEGQKISNLQIVIRNRRQPITISFNNVSIFASNSIIVSKECNEKVIINSYGNSNVLETKDGASGAPGKLEYVDFYTAQYANDGSSGDDGAHVIDAIGDVELYAYSDIKIIGGDGGNGGSGASHKSGPQYVAKNNGGNGGRGGNGGYAIFTEGTAKLYKEDSVTTIIVGGKGGQGGSGGSGGGGIYNSKSGQSGAKGTDGKSGFNSNS